MTQVISDDTGEVLLSYCSETGRPEEGTPVSPLIVDVKQFGNLYAVQWEENGKSQTVGKRLPLARIYVLLCQKSFILRPSERNKSTTCNSLRSGVAIVAIVGLFWNSRKLETTGVPSFKKIANSVTLYFIERYVYVLEMRCCYTYWSELCPYYVKKRKQHLDMNSMALSLEKIPTYI